ncbi:MAG: hypothetical protein GEU79_08590 [Acidimicrobiia bacterium]|nr:hypothetical protein [Acidimicrobiia bacterium]
MRPTNFSATSMSLPMGARPKWAALAATRAAKTDSVRRASPSGYRPLMRTRAYPVSGPGRPKPRPRGTSPGFTMTPGFVVSQIPGVPCPRPSRGRSVGSISILGCCPISARSPKGCFSNTSVPRSEGARFRVAPMPRLIASFFGTGLVLRRLLGSDAGSGTLASVVAGLLSALLIRWGWGWQALAAVLCVVAGRWALDRMEDDDPDPGWVVIDEAAGTFIATVALTGWWLVLGVALFRVVDIWKTPFPGVIRAEAIPGSRGILTDDIVAGLYALAGAWAARYVWSLF